MTGPDVHVVCVVAHPDDAEIAIGGSIATWTQAGVLVTVVMCSTSEQTRELSRRRRRAAEQAAQILGHKLVWLMQDDVHQVENVPEYRLVGLLDDVIRQLGADVVVTHNEFDSHTDHRRVAAAVLASSRTWPDAALLNFGIGEHRTAAYTRFQPALMVPVAGELGSRRAALSCYDYDGKGFRTLDVDGGELRSRALGSLCDVEAAEPLAIVHVVAGTRGGLGLAHLLSHPREVM